MIHEILAKEDSLKESALSAAERKDWNSVVQSALELVRIYSAILDSGEVAIEERQRWQNLKTEWSEILKNARLKNKTTLEKRQSCANNATVSTGRSDISSSKTMTDGAPENSATETSKPTPPAKKITFADVKGLDKAKQAVMDALVNPVRHPDIYKELKIKGGKGLLLYGPPGTGKTMFARAVAGELELPFLYRKTSDLKDKYVGESEKRVAELFAEAAKLGRCVLFLDECDSLLRRRGDQKVCIVEQFLTELDGFASNRDSRMFVILATNRPWLIDSAVLRSGRIGLAVHVGLPDADTRRAILEAGLRGVPLAPDVSLDELVSQTEGWSGAELNHGDGGGLCNEASLRAGRRWVARRATLSREDPEWSRVEPVSNADFQAAFQTLVPVSAKDPDIVRRNADFSMNSKSASD